METRGHSGSPARARLTGQHLRLARRQPPAQLSKLVN